MSVHRPIYPFSALVGQERLKLALILNAVNPRIGGVLIRGEKGTAKSTAVRGLARLLPPITAVRDCPYSCAPDAPAGLCDTCMVREDDAAPLPTTTRPTRLVELPVSASEDRLVGTLDLEHAITEGKRRFEPGLLAQVNRGLLYVDEVNLLDDHLVDVLLDAAAMGVNTVEREGVSVSHPARFILVGTMNPEEGELRPQLLDRFGLAVEIAGLTDVSSRVAVIERRMAYDEDPAGFLGQWSDAEQASASRIDQARQLLPQVRLRAADLALVAALVIDLGVDGHRADLTILEAARTHAAWSARTHVTTEDIRLATELALPHRLRRQPFAEISLDEQRIDAALERSRQARDDDDDEGEGGAPPEGQKKSVPDTGQADTPETDASPEPGAGMAGSAQAASHGSQANTPGQTDATVQGEDPFRAHKLASQGDRQQRRAAGRRTRTRTNRKQGRYIRSRRANPVTDLALDATIREAAPYQQQRRARWSQPHHASGRVYLQRADMRQKVRVRRTRNAVCFVVDASWSMAAEERMQATKTAILSLLRDAYQQRDCVGLVSFQRDYARVLLPLTNSVELAQRSLQQMPTGGKTPLGRGLLTGFEVLARARHKDPEILPLLVVITDGQANVAMSSSPPQREAYDIATFIAAQDVRAVAIDTEHPHFDRGLTRQLAQYLEGQYVRLQDLHEDGMAHMVRTHMQR